MPQNNKRAGRTLYMITSGVTRLVTLGYAALAVFAFLETRKLLPILGGDTSFQMKEGTLYVPLVSCLPDSIDIDGETVLSTSTSTSHQDQEAPQNSTEFNANSNSECRELNYFIAACAFSLIFSAFSSVIYVVVSSLTRSTFGPFRGHSNGGMALFFSLILVQAGFTTGALLEQNRYWIKYIQQLAKDRDLNLTVQSYAHSTILVSSVIFSFGVALIVMLDEVLYPCCRATSLKEEPAKKETVEEEMPEEDLKQQSTDIEEPGFPNLAYDTNSQGSSSERPPWIAKG